MSYRLFNAVSMVHLKRLVLAKGNFNHSSTVRLCLEHLKKQLTDLYNNQSQFSVYYSLLFFVLFVPKGIMFFTKNLPVCVCVCVCVCLSSGL